MQLSSGGLFPAHSRIMTCSYTSVHPIQPGGASASHMVVLAPQAGQPAHGICSCLAFCSDSIDAGRIMLKKDSGANAVSGYIRPWPCFSVPIVCPPHTWQQRAPALSTACADKQLKRDTMLRQVAWLGVHVPTVMAAEHVKARLTFPCQASQHAIPPWVATRSACEHVQRL